tara:strand:+ start:584 stop:1543 length:960 start_codon:yes stop_codon:yes gene_type:complete
MSEFVPTEKGMPIRQPSIANLMIDSADRFTSTLGAGGFSVPGTVVNTGSPFNFNIQRTNSVMNGFFTRLGATEMIFEYNIPNINAAFNNTKLNWYVPSTNTMYSTTILTGNYTVSQLAAQVVANMNSDGPKGAITYNLSTLGASASLYTNKSAIVSNQTFSVSTPTLLANELFIPNTAQQTLTQQPLATNIDLRPFRYLDFTCRDLTYNQSVKDTATNNTAHDVLVRWYFDYDNAESLDSLGYPIHQGYLAFNERRLFNPPKQIRWSPNMPIGNMGFVVYDPQGRDISSYISTDITNGVLGLTASAPTNWLMTIQASEV